MNKLLSTKVIREKVKLCGKQPSALIWAASAAELPLPGRENPSEKQTAPSHLGPPLQIQLKIHKASMLHGECRTARNEIIDLKVLVNFNVEQLACETSYWTPN